MLVSDKVATPQTSTPSDRGSSATSRLRTVLHLPELSAAELKRLSLAIAMLAAEEAEKNTRFADRLLTLYSELAPKKPPRKEAPHYTGEDLVPISSAVGYRLDIFGPPQPEILLKIFGKEQLAKVLSLFKPTKLKEAAAILMEQHPGTKPRTKTKKEDLIDYIVTQVTQDAK